MREELRIQEEYLFVYDLISLYSKSFEYKTDVCI